MIPPGTTKEQFDLMLQNLLADRFHLGLHHETKEIQGYELVTAKNGPKLRETSEGDASPPQEEPASPPKRDANGFTHLDRPGLIMMEGVKGKAVISYLATRAQPLSALADFISKEFRLPVLYRTGLFGKFDFALEFAPQAPDALTPPSSVDGRPNSADENGPNLLIAVQELGLKLSPKKVAVDMLIIDRADQISTEN